MYDMSVVLPSSGFALSSEPPSQSIPILLSRLVAHRTSQPPSVLPSLVFLVKSSSVAFAALFCFHTHLLHRFPPPCCICLERTEPVHFFLHVVLHRCRIMCSYIHIYASSPLFLSESLGFAVCRQLMFLLVCRVLPVFSPSRCIDIVGEEEDAAASPVGVRSLPSSSFFSVVSFVVLLVSCCRRPLWFLLDASTFSCSVP